MFVPGPARFGLARVPLLPADPADTVDDGVLAEATLLTSGNLTAVPPGDNARAHTERAYRLRARHRPTPLGVFAGICDLEWTTGAAKLRMGEAHRTVSYPNPTWLHHVRDELLHDPAVLRAVTFTANPLSTRRGDRVEAECPDSDTGEPVCTRIRATPAITLILRICRHGATWTTITDAIAQAWPNVPASRISATLRTLTRDGLLLCDLTPDDVRADPLLGVLRHVPVSHRLHSRLRQLHGRLADADAHPPGAPPRTDALHAARQLCDAVTDVTRPICVDTAVNAHIRLPQTLTAQAVSAANLLWRTGTSRDRLHGWHARFLDRYGPHRFVPLLEATDATTGLGTDTDHAPERPNPRRDAVVTDLYARAIAEGAREVVLDEPAVAALSLRSGQDRPPGSAEIHAHVIARNVHDRGVGEYFLAITRTGQPAGTARGRFTTLLPTTPTPASDNHAVEAELAFTPRYHVGAALTSDTVASSYRIRLAGQPHDGDLLLDELAIVSTGHRLILWSLRLERQVIPVHRNPIGHSLMPPLAAWLCLLGQHPATPLTTWSWGPMEHAPFLPRVRFDDTILTPARWRLPASLTTATGNPSRWALALNTWRRHTTPVPPDVVVTDDDDRRIPLTLDRDDDAQLLRRYVRRGLATVSEPHGGSETVQTVVSGPHGHHVLEVVIPLTAATPTTPATVPHRDTVREFGQGRHLPGGPWLSAAIRAPHSAHDTIITAVRDLALIHHGLLDRWFFLRYRTDALGEHVRVRFRGDPETLGGRLLPELHHLCARLHRDRLTGGFVIEPYDQEIERYGGPEAMAAAETVFHRDSEAVAALLNGRPDTDTRIAAAAVAAANITRVVAGSDRSALEPYRLDRTDRSTFETTRPQARKLDASGYIGPTDTWHARADALRAYTKVLPANRKTDCASSLIHMHVNRLMGDNRHERVARALAKDLIARGNR